MFSPLICILLIRKKLVIIAGNCFKFNWTPKPQHRKRKTKRLSHMQTEPKAHTQTRKKASAATTHLKNVLNMLVMPEFSGAAGVSELDGGDEAGDVTEEDE
jgi:hypothetical protein